MEEILLIKLINKFLFFFLNEWPFFMGPCGEVKPNNNQKVAMSHKDTALN